MKASVVMASFRRAHLLRLGLRSIAQFDYDFPVEIIIVNDGLEDETESVCNEFKDQLDIKYLFTGHRNRDGIQPRCPGIALNIGVKQSTGDAIILTCPEIFHLSNCIKELMVHVYIGRFMVIPESMYFDDDGLFTRVLLGEDEKYTPEHLVGSLTSGCLGWEAVQMPFLLAIRREEFMAIRGYDEDFTGYACDDNDLVDRLKTFGCAYVRATNTKIVHLYHGKHCDSQAHPEDPKWAHNYKLFCDRKGTPVRNQGREWGVL